MWGLSPAIVPGQGRPYGPDIVQTVYPRAQNPRYLNMDYGVVGRAQWKWPGYPPASGPGAAVFRMPLTAPGIREDDGPETYERAEGFKGMGYIPVGRAQPPWQEVTPRDMAGGLSGVPEALENLKALGSPGIWGPALGGVVAMFVAPALPQGGAQVAVRLAGLGGVALGVLNLWKSFTAAQTAAQPEASAAFQTGKAVETIATKGSLTEADKRFALSALSCYENKRTRSRYWDWVIGKQLEPLKECGLTEAQLDRLVEQVNRIAPAERHRIFPALYDTTGQPVVSR
jgi:hypothetical protein